MFLFWYPEDPYSDSSLINLVGQVGRIPHAVWPTTRTTRTRSTDQSDLYRSVSHVAWIVSFLVHEPDNPPPPRLFQVYIGNIHCTCTFIMHWSVCKSIGRHCLYYVAYILNFMIIQVLLWGNDEPSFEFEITRSSVKVYS